MSFVVTGGAGFIGSSIVRALNDSGIDDIFVVDNICRTEKWRNLVNKKFIDYIHKDRFLQTLPELGNISHIIHMGACSSTTEDNFDYLYANNTDYSKNLWHYCAKRGISLIYASSAATYGAGDTGFSDEADINILKPLNGYGFSKHLFDLWAAKQEDRPRQFAGLKFFNVYGPNEYFKGSMASVIFHGFKQIKSSGELRLFKSHNEAYSDGGQLRDFIYVKDVCEIIKYFINNDDKSGLFNVGTGRAESFSALGRAVFEALGVPENIIYIDMPEPLRDKYQYFTEANLNKLRGVGYEKDFHSLAEGTNDYVRNYLARDFLVY